MRRIVTFAAALLISASAVAQTKPVDPADHAFSVLAGPAWEKARYFEFTFNVYLGNDQASSFPQRWDRMTGEYRVSGRDQKGNDFLAILNTNSGKGRAWLNGEAVTDSRLNDVLTFAQTRFSNDTFWLLMPMRLYDPRFHRTPEGERTDSCGRTWDLYKIASASNTPSDVYWAWINRDTGIVEEFDIKPASSRLDDPPVSVMFHDYGRFAGLLISTRRELRNKNQIVVLDNLKVSTEVPKGAFEK